MTHFDCARCGGHYEKDPSLDTEAEAVQRFGEMPTKYLSICDDCDEELQAWLRTPDGMAAYAEFLALQALGQA